MKNTLVHKDLVNLPVYADLNEIESSLLDCICNQMSSLDDNPDIPLETIYAWTGITDDTRLEEVFDSMARKLAVIKYAKNDHTVTTFSLFEKYDLDYEKLTLTPVLNSELEYMLKNFTEKDSIVDIDHNSIYHSTKIADKVLLSHLAARHDTGRWVVLIDEYKRKCGCLSGTSTKDLMKRIVYPSVQRVREYIPDLKVTPERKGRSYHRLVFTYTPGDHSEEYMQALDFIDYPGLRDYLFDEAYSDDRNYARELVGTEYTVLFLTEIYKKMIDTLSASGNNKDPLKQHINYRKQVMLNQKPHFMREKEIFDVELPVPEAETDLEAEINAASEEADRILKLIPELEGLEGKERAMRILALSREYRKGQHAL